MEAEGMTEQLWVLEEVGYLSWARLGAMSEERWRRVLFSAPRKDKRKFIEDLWDPKKLGPGHVHNLEHMRKAAKCDMWVWGHFAKLSVDARVRLMRRWRGLSPPLEWF